ncbi:MAG TPA: hypothetical protein VD969_23720 [Symbiobacteriaceae bacterium]|nr:hypothetical protein [Symbiobacteriaceae bacterium]
MTEKNLSALAAAAIAAGKIKLLNVRSIQRRTKNMNDPELVIPAGCYQGQPTALAYPMFEQTARKALSGHDRPGYWEIGEYEEAEDTIAFRPSLVETDASVTCRWDTEKGDLYIDMLPIILIREMKIPEETNVHIPVSTTNVAGVGEVVLLHFDRLTYQPVENGKRAKKDDGTEKKDSTNNKKA